MLEHEQDEDVRQQIQDNLRWIHEADSHQLVVGSRLVFSMPMSKVARALHQR